MSDVRSTPPPASEPDPAKEPKGPELKGPEVKGPESKGPESKAAVAEPPQMPVYMRKPPPPPPPHWQQWQPTGEPAAWVLRIRPRPPAAVRVATLWSALAAGLLAALLLGDGLGVNLLIVALPVGLAAYFAGRTAGRRLRPWTLVWAVGGLLLLVVPALRDAGWPTFLAIVSALAVGSLALHGGRSWPGVFLGSLGLPASVGSGMAWGWQGVRDRAGSSRGRWGPVVRSVAVAAGLLIVFGALFAGADAAFADLLGGLIPDVSVEDSPWRSLLFIVGLVGALAAARTAAAPLRWDRLTVRQGRPRARWEWALPLVVLNLLFAVFIGVQLAVLFGGYDKVLRETGLTYAEYARQGFWQLLMATLLILLVIALASRWAPRGAARDRTLVRVVLGALCVLTLVVVASALRRMDLYVDAYGLTRLRVSVAAMELWLGLVIVLIMAAGAFGVRWLPRAVAGSAAAAVLIFGLFSPDGMVAERNVQRFETTGKIDLGYLQDLSADAVPALDALPEPLRSCALEDIAQDLEETDKPWYATSWGEYRAREILADRKIDTFRYACAGRGLPGEDRDEYGERDQYDEDAEFDKEGELGPYDGS